MVLAAGVAVLTAAAVALVAHSRDAAAADTYVTSVRNAVLRLADGTERTAVVGARVPRGAQLRTGQEGGATLSTAGRDVYVGALSTVDVGDGVHQSLARGQVMVDSRKGPRLQLRTVAGAVTNRVGALSRVETLPAFLRLAVFEGSASISSTGYQASTTVDALHQVQTPYGALPGRLTPLALRDDSWESLLAGGLVGADQDLTHLATSLDGNDGAVLLSAAPVSLRTSPAAPGESRGEQALSVAVAQVAAVADPVPTRLATVRGARADGGSWGVVAALVRARVTAVSALLDAALTPAASPGTVAGGPVPNLPGLFGPSAAPSPSTPVAQPTGVASRGPKPAGSPTPKPTATPTTVVGGVVSTVLGLIPHPSAAPVRPPAAMPSPLLSVNLNLGTLHLGLGGR